METAGQGRMRARYWLIGGAVLLATLVVALAAALALFDWNKARPWISEQVKERTGRDLAIGRLEVHPFSFYPRIEADDVTLSNAEWGEKVPMFVADTVNFSVSLPGLLVGRVIFPHVTLGEAALLLQRDAEGRRNWVLTPEDEKKDEPVLVHELTVNRGRLAVKDVPSDTDVTLNLQTTGDTTQGVAFAGKGRIKGIPLSGKGAGGALMNLRDKSAPYPLSLTAAVGEGSVTFEGTVTGLVTLSAVDGRFGVSGKNVSTLADALDLSFPNTAPYKVSGQLRREGKLWSYGDFHGTVGKSDLRGELSVDLSPKRPVLKGKLASKQLDIADLGGLIGEQPGQRDEKPEGKVLPSQPVKAATLQRIDADVSLTAAQFHNRDKLPLDNLNMKITLVDGVLKADPLVFGVAGGRMSSRVAADSRNGETLAVDIDSNMRGLRISKLVPGTELLDTSLGAIDGKIRLKGRGNSVASVLGTSNGRVDLVSRGGETSNLLAEFAGVDFGEIIKFFVGGDKAIELRCSVAAFNVKDGLMTSEAFVIDTNDTYIGGEGTTSLRDETLDMKLTPLPKDVSILSLRGPLLARGTFAKPQIGLEKSSLARKIGAAVLLALIHPLAAIIPTIETGPGKDTFAPCSELIASLEANVKGGAAKPVPQQQKKKLKENVEGGREPASSK
jgi:uncharacterized protein involved in outer membrane biogenesis